MKKLLLVALVVSFGIGDAVQLLGEEQPEKSEQEEMLLRRERQEQEARRHREPEKRGEKERDLHEQRLRAFLKAKLPFMLRELDDVRRDNPREYGELIRDVSELVQEYHEIKQYAPDVAESHVRSYKLEHEAEAMAERIADSEDPKEKAELTVKLRETLDDIFELRLALPEFHLRQMVNEIEETRAMIERRKDNRDKIIDKRLDELTGEKGEDLEWW